MVGGLIAWAVFVVLFLGPWAGWYFLADDDTLADPTHLDVGSTWRLFVPTGLFVVAGLVYSVAGLWPAFTLIVVSVAANTWLSWQALLAVWGRGIVYMLRRDGSWPNRAGYVTYVGHTGRDWEARKAEHQDDRSPSWEEWKEHVDWRISGPAWRRLTKKSANRLEVRMIRTLSFAARNDHIPPIENDADTAIRGPVHPILSARLRLLRLQAVLIPARALHRKPTPPVEHPAPAQLDERTTPIEDMPEVIEAAEVGASSSSASRPDSSSRPAARTRGAATPPASSAQPVTDQADPTDQTDEPPSVSSSHDEASHPSEPSHVSDHPPEGGVAPNETTVSRDAQSGDDETFEGDPEWADGGVVDTGVADEAAAFLRREAQRSGPSRRGGPAKGGRRSSSGGQAEPEWLAVARTLRGEGLSYDAIRAQLEALGHKTSKATVARWLADA